MFAFALCSATVSRSRDGRFVQSPAETPVFEVCVTTECTHGVMYSAADLYEFVCKRVQEKWADICLLYPEDLDSGNCETQLFEQIRQIGAVSPKNVPVNPRNGDAEQATVLMKSSGALPMVYGRINVVITRYVVTNDALDWKYVWSKGTFSQNRKPYRATCQDCATCNKCLARANSDNRDRTCNPPGGAAHDHRWTFAEIPYVASGLAVGRRHDLQIAFQYGSK